MQRRELVYLQNLPKNHHRFFGPPSEGGAGIRTGSRRQFIPPTSKVLARITWKFEKEDVAKWL